jgi:hypothetical protein
MEIKKNRGFLVQDIFDEHCFLVLIYQGAFLIEKHVQIPPPDPGVAVTVLAGIKPGPAHVLLPIEPAEELVHLFGLGIEYVFIAGNAANVVLRPVNEGRKQ